MFQVIKKDGSLQPFDSTKIKTLVVKAGGTEEEGDQVAAAVEAWLPMVAENGQVDRAMIKNKVLEELDVLNPQVAENIRNYQG